MPPVGVVEIIERDPDGELIGRFAPKFRARKTDDRRIAILPGADGAAPPTVGDRVLAHLRAAEDGRIEAIIIRRLGQSAHRILGVFESGRREHLVRPVDRKSRANLVVAPADSLDAATGELVLAELLPERGHGPRRARIRERLCDVANPRAVSLIAIHAHGIPVEFSSEAIAESESLKAVRAAKDRLDLTDLPLVTIDPEDARDHDDAVFAAADDDPANPGGFILWVAIADVAHYVRPGSALDADARQRGNSVYLPDRVVPMLPERLSNDLCSLIEGRKRPCLAIRIVIDAEGNRRRHRLSRALMQCRASLSYGQVQRAIEGSPDGACEDLMDDVLRPLYAAYAALAKAREARSPLDLDLPERKVVLDSEGRVAEIRLRERLEAHRLIEEFMIQANAAAAEILEAHRHPCLYRIHEPPTLEKLESLRNFLKTLDLRLGDSGSLRAKSFNRLLANARGTPHSEMINEIVLRSQSQAYYGPERLGHFGLSLTSYAHFTSPIRRYADLIVHRSLVRALKLGEDGLAPEDHARLSEIGDQISQYERRAMAAERDSTDRYLASFMADKVGAIFTARISGVTRFGLFVTLLESGADGLIPISSLGQDHFRHDEARHALIGQRSRETFRLGERLRVRLEEATPVTGGLRFALVRDAAPMRQSAAAGNPRMTRRRPNPN